MNEMANEMTTALHLAAAQGHTDFVDTLLAKGWTGINVLPTSYLINAEGKILRKYVGASAQQIEGLRNDIENVVNGRPMGAMILGKPVVTQTKTY